MKPIQFLELLILAAVWGGSFLFMRVAAPELGPIWLVELRMLLAGLMLLPLLLKQGLWSQMRSHWRSLLLVGLLNSAIPFSLLSFTSLFLPAGVTAILNGTVPLFWCCSSLHLAAGNIDLESHCGINCRFSGRCRSCRVAGDSSDG